MWLVGWLSWLAWLPGLAAWLAGLACWLASAVWPGWAGLGCLAWLAGWPGWLAWPLGLRLGPFGPVFQRAPGLIFDLWKGVEMLKNM